MNKKVVAIILVSFVFIIFLISFNGNKKDTNSLDTIEVVETIDLEKQRVIDSIENRKKIVRDSIMLAKQEEEKQKQIDIIKNSIRITSYYISSPNSVGGRDLHFNYQNLSDKTIKYLHFTVDFYNAVGDLVYCEIRNYCSFSGKDTGPVKPKGYGSDGYWENAIYNYQAKKIVLTNISIEYTDGTFLNIPENSLQYVKGYKGK